MALMLGFLLLGLVIGRFVIGSGAAFSFDLPISIILGIVVFAAGVDVGTKRSVFKKLAEHQAKVLLIPFGTVLGSLVGGVVVAWILRMPVNEAVAVAAGYGYYSLSAGILADLGNAGLGALAFITNVLRELSSFLIIPVVAKFLNPYAAIAPGGATTMDTTLGAIARCTNEEVTLLAILNGVILSVLVPVLVPIFYQI